MKFAITCTAREGGEQARMQLRLAHLLFLRDQQDKIFFAGRLSDADLAASNAMFLIVEVADREAATAFIAAEPYTASGQVFASVIISPLAQMIPEIEPGHLDRSIAEMLDASAR
ncbi:MAG TPA: YciI family protein [Ktedonobacteraceae bacterium]|nr:YciI family protein [Ktedonobacteraceae bacterium]